jgi:hypothetical protein
MSYCPNALKSALDTKCKELQAAQVETAEAQVKARAVELALTEMRADLIRGDETVCSSELIALEGKRYIARADAAVAQARAELLMAENEVLMQKTSLAALDVLHAPAS